jgi:hypothetical protein
MIAMRRCAALLSASFLSVAAVAAPRAVSRPTIIPLAPYLDGQLAFETSVGGHVTHVLLDTAGGSTVISPAFAAQIGCRPWGQVTGFQMRGQRLDLQRCDDVRFGVAGLTLSTPMAGIFDITQGLPAGAPPLAGSVALDAFAGRTVTLDVGHRQLIVETPASLKMRIRHAQPVATRFEREMAGASLTPLIGLATPKGQVWLELDSGSDGSVIANRPIAAALGMDPEKRGGQPIALHPIGGPTIETDGHVENLIIDGNVGVRVLRHWILTIDTAREKMWIAPSGV